MRAKWWVREMNKKKECEKIWAKMTILCLRHIINAKHNAEPSFGSYTALLISFFSMFACKISFAKVVFIAIVCIYSAFFLFRHRCCRFFSSSPSYWPFRIGWNFSIFMHHSDVTCNLEIRIFSHLLSPFHIACLCWHLTLFFLPSFLREHLFSFALRTSR